MRRIPLEEVMATHSSILAWGIPWTEEPGGLQSIGSQGVGHDWSDWACTNTYYVRLNKVPPPRCPCPNLWNLWICYPMWQRGLCRCDNVKNLDGKDSLDYQISLWVYPCGYTLWAQCNHKGLFSMEAEGDFPGGPVVKTLPFYCGRHRFEDWLGN